jgi:hypothetical protein
MRVASLLPALLLVANVQAGALIIKRDHETTMTIDDPDCWDHGGNSHDKRDKYCLKEVVWTQKPPN